MDRPMPARRLALLFVTSAVGCLSAPAREIATAPEYQPKGDMKCGVTKSQAEPLIVEWPSTARAKLESKAKQGLVAVRYQGCEMEVLDRCKAPGAYGYSGVSRKNDHVAIRDADELYANVPLGAAKLEATLQKKGQLDVAMTIVGRLESDRSAVRPDELEGDCDGATHMITALTVGAFVFSAGAEAAVGGGATVLGAKGGAKGASSREELTKDGDPARCEKAASTDKAPPEGCMALIRVEVVPLGGLPSRTPAPPPNSDQSMFCASGALGSCYDTHEDCTRFHRSCSPQSFVWCYKKAAIFAGPPEFCFREEDLCRSFLSREVKSAASACRRLPSSAGRSGLKY